MTLELGPHEKLIFKGHPSWRSTLTLYLKGLILVAVAAGIAALITRVAGKKVDWTWVLIIALVGIAVVLIVGYVRRLMTVYTITTERLYIKRGLIARFEQETRLARVQNVSTDQSILDRLLVIGTVEFDTAGTDEYDFQFVGVASPQRVVRAVHKAQREAGQQPAGETAGDL